MSDDNCPIRTTGIAILGATGSIGLNTIDVVSRNIERFKITALTANTQVDRLAELCRKYHPTYAVITDGSYAKKLMHELHKDCPDTQVLVGEEGLEAVVALDETDFVMAAIVGAAGLKSVLAAARKGKRILLANKESLVMSGQILIDEVSRHGASLIPIDSEHNAIFQCIPHNYQRNYIKSGIRKVLLTASGGPFRETPLSELHSITPAQACSHPNWVMGKKISVDSATMMNKGLEVIEARWLFNLDVKDITVVVHPQSVIHSMVEYVDGSVLAQLGYPDMRTPIAHGLAWPDRITSGVKKMDIFEIGNLSFEPPDLNRFPCLRLAMQASQAGGTSATVLNAANEIAVQAFLDSRISFLGIAEVIEKTMNHVPVHKAENLDVILEDDKIAREFTQNLVTKWSN